MYSIRCKEVYNMTDMYDLYLEMAKKDKAALEMLRSQPYILIDNKRIR